MSVNSNPIVRDTASAVRPAALRAGWSAAREVALVVVVYLGYRHVRHLARDQAGRAFGNARLVVEAERRLHMFTEQSVQQAVVHHDAIMWVINQYYARVHFPLTVLFLGWLLLRHRRSYRLARTWLIAVTAVALVIHVGFPLAPPRMFPSLGFVDTLRTSGLRIYSANPNNSVANQYAAMPSLHFGWSVIVAATFVELRRTALSALAVLHPLVTLLAIVVTANHYWMDAVVALALVVGVAMGIRWIDRHRAGSQPWDTVLPVPGNGHSGVCRPP